MKRKLQASQPTIASFFGTGKSQKTKVVDLTDDQDHVEFTRDNDDHKTDVDKLAIMEIPLERNAFNKLLVASKLNLSNSRKVKAVFFLLFDESGKLHPFFTLDPNYFQKPLNLVDPSIVLAPHNNSSFSGISEWNCEVTVNHFRWDIFRKEYKDLSLTLRTNLPTMTMNSSSDVDNLGKAESSDSVNKPSVNASLLKSMIQKGVRRRQTKKAIKLTAYLSQFSLQEVLRRLPVISVEDVILHPSMPILVWLMIAVTKGFHPYLSRRLSNCYASENQPLTYAHYICSLVIGDLSRTDWKDCYPETQSIYERCYSIQSNEDNNPGDSLHHGTNTILSILPNSSSRTIVASLLLRRGYGGMGGDMEMLEEYAILWARRLQGQVHAAHAKFPPWISSYMSTRFLNELNASGSIYGLQGLTWGAQLLQSFDDSDSFDHDGKKCPLEYAPLVMSPNKPIGTRNLGKLGMTDIVPESKLMGTLHIVLERELMRIASGEMLEFHDLSTMDCAGHGQCENTLSLITSLESNDLILEGLDFHCDWSMVEAIVDECEENLRNLWKHDIEFVAYMTEMMGNSKVGSGGVLTEREIFSAAIKSSIWLFRSSINVHRLWNIHSEESKVYQEVLMTQLKKKENLSKVWKIICPEVANYCSTKLQSVIRQINAAQRNRQRTTVVKSILPT